MDYQLFEALLYGPRPIQHSRVRNGLADVLQSAHPGYEPLHAHAEAAMRHRAKAPQIQYQLNASRGN